MTPLQSLTLTVTFRRDPITVPPNHTDVIRLEEIEGDHWHLCPGRTHGSYVTLPGVLDIVLPREYDPYAVRCAMLAIPALCEQCINARQELRDGWRWEAASVARLEYAVQAMADLACQGRWVVSAAGRRIQ